MREGSARSGQEQVAIVQEGWKTSSEQAESTIIGTTLAGVKC